MDTGDSWMLREPWRNDPYALDGKVELVPIVFLKRFRGNILGKTDLLELRYELERDGFRNPLVLQIGQKDRQVKLGEGNHRIYAGEDAGFSHAPVRILRCSTIGDGVRFDHMARVPASGYYPADSPPSTVFDEGVIPIIRMSYPQSWLRVAEIPAMGLGQ